jgi:hypothetical protein
MVSLALPLADAGIPILAIGTYDTDYVLVRHSDLENAFQALARRGTTSSFQPTRHRSTFGSSDPRSRRRGGRRGEVRSALNEQAIAGVIVTTTGGKTRVRTDANGRFRIATRRQLVCAFHEPAIRVWISSCRRATRRSWFG